MDEGPVRNRAVNVRVGRDMVIALEMFHSRQMAQRVNNKGSLPLQISDNFVYLSLEH
jgi:hypothetical protein